MSTGWNNKPVAVDTAAIAVAVAAAVDVPTAADNATAVAAELDTTLTAISDDVVALAPPVLSYATGKLGPADFTVISAVGGQVITVYGFIFWSVDGAARKLAYTNADGSNENYYHASDFNITSNGIDPRSSVITMTPTGRPLYATPSGKAMADAPGLGVPDGAANPAAGLQTDLGQLCGLARTCFACHHNHLVCLEGGGDLLTCRADR